ncbi:hypothetical protein OCO_30870 [Mycobacterium intracellulare MOTT-02]|nr:hypothetical protein OCO_30870 [Mycobacterium intracellulare MOTT-02]
MLKTRFPESVSVGRSIATPASQVVSVNDELRRRGYIERKRTGLLRERYQTTGGLKGRPCGWGVGCSLIVKHFR